MSAGTVEYHAAGLTEAGLLERDSIEHYFCVTDKGRAHVHDNGLSDH